MKQNRVISGAVAALVLAALLAGCGNNNTPAASGSASGTEATGSVYYLNFKPESDQAWQDLAKQYPPLPPRLPAVKPPPPPQNPRPKLLCRTACIPPNLKPTAVWCTPTKPAMARAP